MQNFYVILDYDNSRIALNGVYTPVKEIGTKGYRDPDLYDEDGKMIGDNNKSVLWAIIGSILGVLFIIGIVALIIFKMRDNRLQSNLAKYETL